MGASNGQGGSGNRSQWCERSASTREALWAHAFILVNKFKLFPQPNICFCDAFYQLSLWIKFLKTQHYGCYPKPYDFIFPPMGANDIIYPLEHISHDTVQNWLDEFMTQAGICHQVEVPSQHTVSAERVHSTDSCMLLLVSDGHCMWSDIGVAGWKGSMWVFLRAQSLSMTNLQFLILKHSTLMRYILNELHAYEHDYSDMITVMCYLPCHMTDGVHCWVSIDWLTLHQLKRFGCLMCPLPLKSVLWKTRLGLSKPLSIRLLWQSTCSSHKLYTNPLVIYPSFWIWCLETYQLSPRFLAATEPATCRVFC